MRDREVVAAIVAGDPAGASQPETRFLSIAELLY
jgi:hypothetical protein